MHGTNGPSDGRARRSLRTRTAVVDAMLELIEEGDLRPTAPRIAERAGVSLRSVFQHFSDLDGLFSAAADRELERITAMASPAVRAGAHFGERLRTFVDQRARIYEAITPVRRASLAHEPFSPLARATRDRLLAISRADVERVFRPELGGRSRAARQDVLEALVAVTSWQAWESLRAHQGLTPARARRVLARLVRAVLDEPGRSS